MSYSSSSSEAEQSLSSASLETTLQGTDVTTVVSGETADFFRDEVSESASSHQQWSSPQYEASLEPAAASPRPGPKPSPRPGPSPASAPSPSPAPVAAPAAPAPGDEHTPFGLVAKPTDGVPGSREARPAQDQLSFERPERDDDDDREDDLGIQSALLLQVAESSALLHQEVDYFAL